MNEELRNKGNLIISLLNQLSKQTECITSLNNRFCNNAIDNNTNNNDNLNHQNNSYAKDNNNNNNNNKNNNKNNNNNNNFNINSICISTISNQMNGSNNNSFTITTSQGTILIITIIALVKMLTLRLVVPTMVIYLITIQITITMTPVIYLITIVTTMICLVTT